MDKGWGVEVFEARPESRGIVLGAFPQIRPARPFLQCDSADYLFIEFWTDDEEAILSASSLLEQRLTAT